MPRWIALPFVILLAACPASTREAGLADDGNVPDPMGGARACFDDGDCELASRTCCECPTFATNGSDPKLDACQDVMCPPPQNQTCSRIRAACEDHTCVVKCEPQQVAMSCSAGFAADAAGCLIDACAAPKNECGADTDCARTRADCCGCTRGGSDTAVNKTAIGTFDKSLGCTGTELCPDVNTCDLGETPQCAQGTCKLIAGGLPPDACGRPDLAPCPNGTACTVNANDTANLHGVGVCR